MAIIGISDIIYQKIHRRFGYVLQAKRQEMQIEKDK